MNRDDLSMILNLASKHHQDDRDLRRFNENNYGLGFKYKLPRNNLSLEGGYYKNSLRKDSLYGGMEASNAFRLGPLDLSLGASAGLVTGYNDSVVPYLTPTLGIGGKDYKLKLRYVPKIEGITPETLGFQIEVPFKY